MTHALNEYSWPGQARYAVSLCYDDGNPNNLDYAIPDLETEGIRGTFYLHVGRQDVQDHANDWQAADRQGHEIGNHSWNHNCRVDGGVRHAWISKPLEEYTRADMVAEVARSADWIDAHVGIDQDRSFAYHCGQTAIGNPPDHLAYAEAVRTRHRFARISGNTVNDPLLVDLEKINSVFFAGNTFEEFAEAIEQARRIRGWACLGFHGIGGESHTTTRETHRRILQHLHQQNCWVAPIRDVARYIQRQRLAR